MCKLKPVQRLLQSKKPLATQTNLLLQIPRYYVLYLDFDHRWQVTVLLICSGSGGYRGPSSVGACIEPVQGCLQPFFAVDVELQVVAGLGERHPRAVARMHAVQCSARRRWRACHIQLAMRHQHCTSTSTPSTTEFELFNRCLHRTRSTHVLCWILLLELLGVLGILLVCRYPATYLVGFDIKSQYGTQAQQATASLLPLPPHTQLAVGRVRGGGGAVQLKDKWGKPGGCFYQSCRWLRGGTWGGGGGGVHLGR